MTTPPALPAITSKANLVYEYLRDQILNGHYQPGQRISMDVLVRELGVSKIPIREAIRLLEANGLVVSQQHTGPTVAPVSFEQLRGVYLTRAQLEPMIIRLAATAITNETLAEIEGIQAAMHDRLATGALDALGDLNYKFHIAIATSTRYPIMVEFTEAILLSIRRHRVVDPLDAANWANVVQEHDAIVAALAARDPEAAEQSAQAHVASQAEHNRTDIAPPEDAS